MKLRMLVCLAVLAAAGPATAGTFGTTKYLNLFGKPYQLDFYRVAGDLSPSGPRLEPEGMTWYNGTLYVSGDAGALASPPAESNGYIAAYAGGTLTSAPTALGQFAHMGVAVGPEALTINTRGSGYGSFAGPTPKFTIIDGFANPVGRIMAVEDPSGPSVTDVIAGAANADDIAFVPGASAAQDRFAIIDAGVNEIRFYSTDATPTLLGGNFPIPAEAKGMVYLSQAQAALYSPLADSDCLMLAFKTSASLQELKLFKLDGTEIATAALPGGVAAVPTAGTIGNAEALAFDPATKRLFIGDETSLNSQIVVMTQIPEPAGLSLLGIAALGLVARRRRSR